MQEKYKSPHDHFENQFIKVIDEHELKGILASLGNTLSNHFKGEELLLVGMLKGSFMFLADLVREIKEVKLTVDFVQIKKGHQSTLESPYFQIKKDLSLSPSDKHVLIATDVFNSGGTIDFLKKRVALSAPKSIGTLTLFHKIDQPNKKVSSDFVGKKVRDQFLVGYGLDIEEYGRNFSNIYSIKYPN